MPSFKPDDTFFVLDFDRCLADTVMLHTILEAVIERETGISSDEIATARRAAEAAGESFDTIPYVRGKLDRQDSSITWYDIERRFIEAARVHDCLLPFAQGLFATLNDRQIPFGILTYGDEQWQLAKLEAVGLLSVPYLITHIKEKGKLLSGWKYDDKFVVPPAMTRDFTPLTVSTIVFLDDKAVSFTDIPEGVIGVQVMPEDGKLLPVQEGDVPSSVTQVKGLQAALGLLFAND